MKIKDKLILFLLSGTYSYERIKQEFPPNEQWIIKTYLENMLEEGIISISINQTFTINSKKKIYVQNNQKENKNFQLVATLPEHLTDNLGKVFTTREIFRKIFQTSQDEILIMEPFIDNTFVDIYEDEIRNLANKRTNFIIITRKIIHENINLRGLFRIFDIYSNNKINSKFQIYEHWTPLRCNAKYTNQFIGMHAKVMYCDDMAYIGSANWTSHSLSNNLELGIIVYEKELLNRIKNLFYITLAQSTKIDIEKIYKNLTRRFA